MREMKSIYSKSVRSFDTILEIDYPKVWSLLTIEFISCFSSICEPNICLLPNIQKLVNMRNIGAKDRMAKFISGSSTVNLVGNL